MSHVNISAVEEVFGVNEFLSAPMDDYRAVGIAEGFEEAESESEVLQAWQHLHSSGLAYRLQGWFGRQCRSLIEAGLIEA